LTAPRPLNTDRAHLWVTRWFAIIRRASRAQNKNKALYESLYALTNIPTRPSETKKDQRRGTLYQIWSHADFLQHFSDFWPTSNQLSGQRCVLNTNAASAENTNEAWHWKILFFFTAPVYICVRPTSRFALETSTWIYTSFRPYNVFWVCCGTQYTDARHLHLQVLETEAPSALAVKRLLNPICLTSSSWWTFISSTHHAVRSASS
jgi:hypothetical protein